MGFLSMKNFHPSTNRNRGKIRLAEDRTRARKKRDIEQEQQLEIEIELERMKCLYNGGKVSEKLDWMYDVPVGVIDSKKTTQEQEEKQQEQYLVGKTATLKGDKEELEDKFCNSIQKKEVGEEDQEAQLSQKELMRKIKGDPYLLIKQKEQEQLNSILNNPLRLMALKNLWEKEKEQLEKQGKHKKTHIHKHRHKSKNKDKSKRKSKHKEREKDRYIKKNNKHKYKSKQSHNKKDKIHKNKDKKHRKLEKKQLIANYNPRKRFYEEKEQTVLKPHQQIQKNKKGITIELSLNGFYNTNNSINLNLNIQSHNHTHKKRRTKRSEKEKQRKIAQMIDGEFTILESIPQELELGSANLTYEGWIKLIDGATKTLDIACFYMTLSEGSDYPDANGTFGVLVFEAIKRAADRGVEIRIAKNTNQAENQKIDYLYLLGYSKNIKVKILDFEKLLGVGILHTKFLIVDNTDFYVGSANMDWRSLAQVKELGILIANCECLARDLGKIFQVYWQFGNTTKKLAQHPYFDDDLSTQWNIGNPASVTLNSEKNSVFIASSPPALSPTGRTQDLDAILHIINNAESTLSLEVMDYIPAYLYQGDNVYWSVLDTALRNASFHRNVKIRLLIGKWNYTRPEMFQFLKSLDDLASITVKYFIVPDRKGKQIPWTRVNHAKYAVSESQVFIDTSNWSADYFTSTAGVSFNSYHKEIVSQAQQRFERDWDSKYTHNLSSLTEL
ncbi:phospholipase d - related [Anaeramoeba flamelloides]|uniref:Phospholipase d - related n=1 Tax=Anaeramoeba flamelloides TaxID=1746091 RepID=A0ABQ8YDV9_9EUKA|nr:phospholipase d - related [Anaeramoeba flamelloides]